MAAEGDTGELRAHARAYDRFIWLMKWGAIVSLVVALIVIMMIA